MSTCSTCQRIIRDLGLREGFDLQDVKTTKISVEELEKLRALAGSYEALFSRRSRSYAALGLKDKSLAESDYKELILSDYTFLKRPVVLIGERIFIGNSKQNLMELKEALQ